MKYILVEVADREINHLVYDDLDKAKEALYALYEEVCCIDGLDQTDNYDCWIDDDNMTAYANGRNRQLDWTIIEV